MEARTPSTVKVETPEALVNEILLLLGLDKRKSVTLYLYPVREGVHVSKMPLEGIRQVVFKEQGGKAS